MADRAGPAGIFRPLLLAAAGVTALVIAGSATAQQSEADLPVAVPSAAAAPAPLAPAPVEARWSVATARQLIAAVEGARAEGLNPADYRLNALRRAAAQGAGPQLDAVADASAQALAHDYYFGRVRDRSTMGWLIERSPYEAGQLSDRLQQAEQSGALDRFFPSLLPTDARYAALRDALAQTDDGAMRDRLRANMERWRWLPRAIGGSYLYVNVPSYRLRVIEDGAELASYPVVVGAKDTPTPALISPASSLVVNPWWNVPASIVKSSNLRPGKAGFQFRRVGTDWQVRQPPGPRNALGRIKFNLVNDQAIYLHDTPAKRAFLRDARALSHGCIRVKDIDQLAATLMGDGGDPSAFDTALAGDETATVALPRTWQVMIVYFTADVGEDGQLATYADPYGYDAQVLEALDGRPLEVATRS